MEHICDKCIHCYKPTSVKDYFDKTMRMPDINKWGIDVFKHLFWLCNTEPVSKKDHTNNTLLMKRCIEQNIRGNCETFRTVDSEDIHPSYVEIIPPTESIREGDELQLEVTVKPCIIPAVTEVKTVHVEEDLVDETGGLILNENGQPQTVVIEKKETVIIVPEHENDQEISYSYQWYKNFRKLFQETKSTITIDTSKESEDTYFCKVFQYIKNNGDGGIKSVEVISNTVVVKVIGVNKILLHLIAGTDPTSIALPFTPSLIQVPYALTEGWVIQRIENTENVVLTKEVISDVTIECTDGINAEFGKGLEISGENGSVLIKWDKE